jgi:hypothetical protein
LRGIRDRFGDDDLLVDHKGMGGHDPPSGEGGVGVVPWSNQSNGRAQATFLEPHDCVVSNSRHIGSKDVAFAAAMLESALIDPTILAGRIDLLPASLDPRVRARLLSWLKAWADRHDQISDQDGPWRGGVRFGWMLASNARWTWPGVQSRPDVRHRTTGTLPKAVTRSVTRTPRDGPAPVGTDATVSPWRAGRMVVGETYRVVWDGVRLAHNPEVAGSNPAPATNASAV